jgi:hypothetical protein
MRVNGRVIDGGSGLREAAGCGGIERSVSLGAR